MNAQTASYYRAILYNDGQDERKLPESLIRLHTWAQKRCQALGISSTIPKATALSVTLQWLAGTEEGRAFSRTIPELGDLFSDESGDTVISWKDVAPNTPVIVSVDGKPVPGLFVSQRGSWIDVKIDGVEKHVRVPQVKLAGA